MLDESKRRLYNKGMEEWRDIKGFEGYYQVSSKGRIWSCDRTINTKKGWSCTIHGKVLAERPSSKGYNMVSLQKHGVVVTKTAHSLVADAFIPNPKKLAVIHHIDGNKLNNIVDNLERCTQSENVMHAFDVGAMKGRKGEKNPRALLTESNVRCIRLSNAPTKELSNIYKVSPRTINNIKARRLWRHVQ